MSAILILKNNTPLCPPHRGNPFVKFLLKREFFSQIPPLKGDKGDKGDVMHNCKINNAIIRIAA
jgi:hypothetical protein